MYVSLQEISTWPTPNYVDPMTRGPGLVIMNLVLYPIIIVVVSLRVYTRLRISRSFGLDDVFIALAMIPTTAFLAVILVAEFRYGWNRHAWDVPPQMVTVGLQLSLVSQITYAAASDLTRLSMLFLCWRILSAQSEALRNMIIFVIALVGISPLIFIIIAIFQCSPIADQWTISFVPQNCVNQEAFLLIEGVLNIIADFLVVLIPIPVVMRLNLPMRQRILVSILFGAGFIVCVAGIVRTVYLYRVTDGNYDVTWDAYPAWLSTIIELYIGILCTSIPPTKPFFARYLPKLLITTRHQDSSGGGWTPASASSRNVLKQSASEGSRNADHYNNNLTMELGDPPYSANSDRLHKIDFQSSFLEISSNKTSAEHLVV